MARGAWIACLLAMTFWPTLATADDATLVVRLVPESRWSDRSPPAREDVLPDGRVFFFREGDYSPSLVLDANREITIPPGSWVWTAEAEGFVSVVGGTIRIPADHVQERPKVIYWPVVPACLARLDPSPAWRGVQRLDIVSVTADAVYPVIPADRREAWIPAGRLLAYGVGARGLVGIDDLGSCSPNQRVSIQPPSPPGRRQQELMVTAYLPEESDPELREDIELFLDGLRSPSVRATARVEVGDRISAFFLGVPADEERRLLIRHPETRSASVRMPPLGGSARELDPQRLRPRRSLAIEAEYRPLRDHDRAEIRGYYCGTSRRLDARTFARCKPLDHRPTLRPGLHEYVFESLDDGQYYFEAWIDGFVVPGLGAFVSPYLAPDDDEVPTLDRALLHEQVIHGELQVDGEPVAGSVRLLSIYEKLRRLPDHRYRTDETGSFELFYFGRQPGPYAEPPGFRRSSDPARTLGLYGDYQLVACIRDGHCRPYSVHSVLQGSGRLVLDVGEGTPVEVVVTAEDSGEPVPDALILVPAPAEALYFHHGEIDWFEPRGSEGAYVRTDRRGVGRLLADAGERSVLLAVHHPEYEPVQDSFSVVPREQNRIEMVLAPKKEITDGRRFAFPDGEPMTNGFLLVVDPRTGIDGRCSTTTNSRGHADLSDDCLRGRTLIVIAPGARISLIDGSTLIAYGDVKMPRSPSEPLVLRVVDRDGRPLAGLPIELRYPQNPRILLGPNEILMAATHTGYQAFYLTNDRGEIELRGVDPEAPAVPDVRVPVSPDSEWEPLSPYRRGERVTITLEPEGG